MKTLLVDGWEYPADPPPRPGTMSDVRALTEIVKGLEAARGLVGFHERGLYKLLCRTESAVRNRLESARDSGGSTGTLAENPKLWPGE